METALIQTFTTSEGAGGVSRAGMRPRLGRPRERRPGTLARRSPGVAPHDLVRPSPAVRRPGLALSTVALVPAVLGSCPGSGSDGPPGPPPPFDRPSDGIVVQGSALPGLLGSAPGGIAAFRWTEAGGWAQVPVQVDERALVPWVQIYGGVDLPWYEELGPDDQVLTWCDPTTFTGPDPDPALDADDEVALASIDAGERAPFDAPLPEGALPAGATELRLFDPLDGGVGWLYLVRPGALLDPAAGEARGDDMFHLASGLSYLDGYQVVDVPNPELTTVTAPGVWSTGFFDRWIRDGLWVHDGVAASVNLIDRQRTTSDPPKCFRNEDTFCGY